ncbi:hypothetical protein CYJ34_05955 [Anaerococcus octavius]|uniref:Uncharacterized protein n=1 Tax=Anaerococcus octavius TaxID=54007 RepID=A0A2I1M8A6_9FIRM|nr:hypothetical protein CYJ34_05955 [Anaerococcus octavius]
MLIVLVSLLVILSIVKNYDEYKIMNKMLVAFATVLNIIIIAVIAANEINFTISLVLSNVILLELSQYIYYNSSPRDSTILKYFLYINKIVLMVIIFLLLNKIY